MSDDDLEPVALTEADPGAEPVEPEPVEPAPLAPVFDPAFGPMLAPVEPAETVTVTRPGAIDRLVLEASARVEPELAPVEPAETVTVTRPGAIDRLVLEASARVEPEPEPEPAFLCTDAARRLAGLVGK